MVELVNSYVPNDGGSIIGGRGHWHHYITHTVFILNKHHNLFSPWFQVDGAQN
jgi:hypothetical protein